ncbi:MAG: hypothetical protein ACRD44_17310, partial [Bryobacteraceae bacterium]
NTPVKQAYANFNYTMPKHLLSFGWSFTQINTWGSANTGTAFVNTVPFATATNDPVNFGTTSLFTPANFPNSATGDRTNAASLYALLTGRVSAINRGVNLGEQSKTYGVFPPVTRTRQRQQGFYLQDSWRMRPGLTINYGLRWDRMLPPEDRIGIYTRPGYEGVWGVSGVGNIFAPGVLSGRVPQYFPVEPGTKGFKTFNRMFSPSFGLAWVVPKSDNPVLGLLAGSGNTVLRFGYGISSIREDAGRLGNAWGGNQGRTVTLNVDPNNFPADFGPAGSVWFRDPRLPVRAAPTAPAYPLAVLPGNNVGDFDPNLKTPYVQSWTFSIQRELAADTVLELRYVGNHGTRLWRNVNLNETNIFENGFLDEFRLAMENLRIARASQPPGVTLSNNFGNQGLPGQRPIPIIQTALGTTTDSGFATNIERGLAGTVANNIATNATRMTNLTRAGYPVNLFRVNPTLVGGNSNLYINGGSSSYHAMQIEARRRMSAGLLLQGSYAWSKGLANFFGEGVGGSFTTFRDGNLNRGPSPWDIRHAVKLNWIYELPIGPRKSIWNNVQNSVLRKATEGWELASVTRIQSGTPLLFTGGRGTFNQNDAGVVLYNMTARQLQDSLAIRKTTSAATRRGVIYYLPQDFIDNSMAAFEVGGRNLSQLDRSKPYIGPPATPGQLGYNIFLYGNWFQKWDFSVVKKTYIGERANIEFRTQFLNAFNLINFAVSDLVDTSGVGSGFGQVGSAYQDLNNTQDPGARVIEFVLRINF